WSGYAAWPKVADAVIEARLFAALADGGQVQMPLTPVFFAPRVGMVADRFGVSWMVHVAPCAPAPPCAGRRNLRQPVVERSMPMNTATVTAEAEIRAQVDNWLHAVLAMDIAGIVSHYAPGILAFDAVSQLPLQGVDVYSKHWHACLAMCRPDTMIVEMRDVHVAAGDDVAFATARTRCGGTGENGEAKAGWMRMTAGCRKTHGQWMVADEACFAPFDMGTLRYSTCSRRAPCLDYGRAASVAKVGMVTVRVLISQGLFPSLSTFETPPARPGARTLCAARLARPHHPGVVRHHECDGVATLQTPKLRTRQGEDEDLAGIGRGLHPAGRQVD